MSGPFENKNILLGISGSIAAYKSIDVASKLTQAGANVDVIMTYSATQFVAPLTFRSITHRSVHHDVWDINSPEAVEHVALAERGDILIIAPATAHMIGKLALGLAEDPISITAIATSAPLLLAPAMDANMWSNPAVQKNISTLIERGATIIEPEEGRLASGLTGVGRLADTSTIIGEAAKILGVKKALAGHRIIVTAGGTQEAIDPVRVITNHSSGKMGYAIAEAGRDLGAEVILITAPTALDLPSGITTIKVKSTSDMHKAVTDASGNADAIIMAAAVADFRPAKTKQQKMKKSSKQDQSSIDLEQTEDIISNVSKNLIRVAFAAETENLLENAKAKLEKKQVDLVVANDISSEGSGFGSDANKVWVLDTNGVEDLPLMPKYDVALAILDKVAALLASK